VGAAAGGLCVVVTDVQAGLSTDLVALLAAAWATRPRPPPPVPAAPAPHRATATSAGAGPSRVTYELLAHVGGHTGERLSRTPAHAPGAGLTPQHSLSLSLGRLRLYLVSTRMQTVDPATGLAAPLPAACLRHVTAVVHWTLTAQPSCVLDPHAVADAGTHPTHHAADGDRHFATHAGRALYDKLHGQGTGECVTLLLLRPLSLLPLPHLSP